MIQVIILIFAVIIIILSINFKYFNDIILLSNDELQSILVNNKDNYYDRFTKLDLKVRNVNTLEEYKNKILNSCYKCNQNEYNILLVAVNKINKVLKNYKIIGFDGKKAVNIKWKIGVIDGEIYENGLPHTRGDVIIIPKSLLNNDRLKNILLHEKIHIYQKIYPNDIQQYLNNNGFTISRKKIDNIRANPDIDIYIYKNKNNQEMMCIYNNSPKSILDVLYLPNNNIINEHPFEFMAYNIENQINF